MTEFKPCDVYFICFDILFSGRHSEILTIENDVWIESSEWIHAYIGIYQSKADFYLSWRINELECSIYYNSRLEI